MRAGQRVAGRRVPARLHVEPERPRRPGRGQPDLGRVEALEARAVDTDQSSAGRDAALVRPLAAQRVGDEQTLWSTCFAVRREPYA